MRYTVRWRKEADGGGAGGLSARRAFALLSSLCFTAFAPLCLSGCDEARPGEIGTLACLGCHNGSPALDRTGFLESAHASAGVSCEDCHGPGLAHVRYGGAPGLFINNPAKGDFSNSYQSCTRCHANTVGQFLTSTHARLQVAACYTCHTFHRAEPLAASATDNSLCLSCHEALGFESGAAIAAHTFHGVDPEATGASRCTACHMPPLRRENQESGYHGHDWVVREPIFPNLAADAGIDPVPPSSCAGIAGCHDGSVVSAPLFNVDNLQQNEALQSIFELRYGKGLAGELYKLLHSK